MKNFDPMGGLFGAGASSSSGGGRLVAETRPFGANPGGLTMWTYAPKDLGPKPPLVVVLHGCTQSAEAYASGAGWLELADRFGFVVLCPEQVAANNPNRCFNWFQPEDQKRGHGEAASIRAMIEATVQRHDCNRARIFVTGLSAGGAMAGVMLAAYPEVFAGGGVVAGLAYGAADSMPSAFTAMFQCAPKDARALGDGVRAASSHRGPWPRVAIWHGDADHTVVPANAEQIAKQWADVHGAARGPTRRLAGRTHASWQVEGETVVELHAIAGMAHGTPLATGGADGCGAIGPFLIEADVSSSLELLRFWGVALAEARKPRAVESKALALAEPDAEALDWTLVPANDPPSKPGRSLGGDIEATITKALRSAGLMPR